jgi:DNA excision repair protein ERCC-3
MVVLALSYSLVARVRRLLVLRQWLTCRQATLILVTNTAAARQWRDELLKRTSLHEDEIGEYSGAKKEIRPVTIATYQVLTTRKKGLYAHLDLFDAIDWGLIIYD